MEELHDISQAGELWKPIPNTNNKYYISSFGRGYTIHRRRLMKPRLWGSNRYLYLHYNDSNGKPRCVAIHRLVAQAFIENPLNKLEVNHIDGNKFNNNVSNLEWSTRQENMRHAFISEVNLKKLRPIVCVELNKTYPAMIDASKDLNIPRQNIYSVCVGRRTSAGGYTFRYLEEVE